MQLPPIIDTPAAFAPGDENNIEPAASIPFEQAM